jgi:hypothetical protein
MPAYNHKEGEAMKKSLIALGLVIASCWPGMAVGLSLADYKVKISQPKDGVTKEMKILILLASMIGVGIENKTKEPIIIDWKLAAYTDHFGHTSKVKVYQDDLPHWTHDPTVVPPGARVMTPIISTDNLKASSFEGMPYVTEMYPKYYVEAQALVPSTPASLLLPVMIGSKQTFVTIKYTYTVAEGAEEESTMDNPSPSRPPRPTIR